MAGFGFRQELCSNDPGGEKGRLSCASLAASYGADAICTLPDFLGQVNSGEYLRPHYKEMVIAVTRTIRCGKYPPVKPSNTEASRSSPTMQ